MQEKFTLVGICGLVCTIIGKLDWMLVIYLICLVLDYVSGTLAALKKKGWTASKAALGIWKKVGSIFSVIVGMVLDLLLHTFQMNYPGMQLPFDGKPIFCCLVLAWSIVTELGSIMENAEQMGAHIPKFLLTHIKKLKRTFHSGAPALPKEPDKNGNAYKGTKKK